MTFQLTNEKVKSIIHKCQYIRKKADPVTAREVAMVTGSLQFAINVIPMGNLHFRNLQKQISEATLLGDWDKKLVLNQDSISELDWWISNIEKKNLNLLRPHPISVVITSDASQKGWGGTYWNLETKKKIKTQGVWTKEESVEQINVLELKAALFALQALAKNVTETSIKIRMDNTSAVAAVRKMGSSKNQEMNKISGEL